MPKQPAPARSRSTTRSRTRSASVNQAEAYGVRLSPATVAARQPYWRVINVRHLPPAENGGRHNIFVDALDESGQRLRDPNLCIGWTWQDRNADEEAEPKALDKPDSEPAGNLDVYHGQIISVWITGDGLPSERVENLHTNHIDELAEDGFPGNTRFHHSFHVTFQRSIRTGAGGNPDEQSPTPVNPAPPNPTLVEPQPNPPPVEPTPVEPPLISSATGNKLGFYLHLSTDQFGLWDAIARVRPPVILFHADSANSMLLEEIRCWRAPDAFVIGRIFKDGDTQRRMLEGDNPEGEGCTLAEEIITYDFGLASRRSENGRLLIDAWMSLNEAVPGPNSSNWRENESEVRRLLGNYDRFQVAFRQRLQEAGLEAVAFNFGAGNFSQSRHYLDHFPGTLATFTYLGFHEYGWPTLYPASGSASSALDYQRCMTDIRERYGNRHRVIITEAGLTRAFKDPALGDVGWLNHDTPLSEEDYWRSLAWYNAQISQDASVIGACLFEVGHHGDWASFRHLGQDNDGNDLRLIERMAALNDVALNNVALNNVAMNNMALIETQSRGAVPMQSTKQPTRKPTKKPIKKSQSSKKQSIPKKSQKIAATITVRGQVRQAGKSVTGASVRLVGRQTTASVVTKRGGHFRFDKVQPGDYQLEVQVEGMPLSITALSCQQSIEVPIELATLPVAAAMAERARGLGPDFVRVAGEEFVVGNQRLRFIGANIRGIVHYGDERTLEHARDFHRNEQLAAARDMGVKVIRVFLPCIHANTQQVIDRFRSLLDLMRRDFPGIYVIPALHNLYGDNPFRVAGDEGFYEKLDPNFDIHLLNSGFFGGGYQQNYLPFVRQVVTALRDDPLIFAWEIGNELKLDLSPQMFVTFMLRTAAEIRQIDRNHLITTGMISTRHASINNDALKRELYGVSAFDFITVHCYNNEYENDDSDLARSLRKPFIIEEAGYGNGFLANHAEKDRSVLTRQDMNRWFERGARGYMPWGFMATGNDIGDGDADSGLDKTLHGDWDAIFNLLRERANELAQVDPNWQPAQPAQPPTPVTPSTFQVGQTIFTQTSVNLRASPARNGAKLTEMALGTQLTVRAGATIADGLTWWPVRLTQTNGSTLDGFAAEASNGVALLGANSPVLSRGAAMAGALPRQRKARARG